MRTLAEIMALEPRNTYDVFLGVIEYDNRFVVGVIDEPMGIDSREARLSYPVEFMFRPKVDPSGATLVELGFIEPVLGIPEERLTDGQIDIHRGNSPIGVGYFGALKIVKERKIKYSFSMMSEPTKKEGN